MNPDSRPLAYVNHACRRRNMHAVRVKEDEKRDPEMAKGQNAVHRLTWRHSFPLKRSKPKIELLKPSNARPRGRINNSQRCACLVQGQTRWTRYRPRSPRRTFLALQQQSSSSSLQAHRLRCLCRCHLPQARPAAPVFFLRALSCLVVDVWQPSVSLQELLHAARRRLVWMQLLLHGKRVQGDRQEGRGRGVSRRTYLPTAMCCWSVAT